MSKKERILAEIDMLKTFMILFAITTITFGVAYIANLNNIYLIFGILASYLSILICFALYTVKYRELMKQL